MKDSKNNSGKMIIIDMDGHNLGVSDAFSETYLTFKTYSDAKKIRDHYEKWMKNGDQNESDTDNSSFIKHSN